MASCPKCKGRATKLFNLSTGVMTCQQCNALTKACPHCGQQREVDQSNDKEVRGAAFCVSCGCAF